MPNCTTPYCRNKAAKCGKCWKCLKRDYRERNPLKSAYQNLKQSARRRGKDFTITFDQFKAFATRTDYINKKGISSEGFHVDRINEDEGYHIWNIQALPNSENIKKYMRYHYNGSQMEFRFEKETKQTANAPF